MYDDADNGENLVMTTVTSSIDCIENPDPLDVKLSACRVKFVHTSFKSKGSSSTICCGSVLKCPKVDCSTSVPSTLVVYLVYSTSDLT